MHFSRKYDACKSKTETLRDDVRKAGEEEDWQKKTRDRGAWKRLTPDKGETRKRVTTTYLWS